MSRDTTRQSGNATHLRGLFLEHGLFPQRPGRVVDVGCGRGELLAACRARGITAVGLEASAERLASLDGPVVHGRAERLPFADASVDWALMRHVAHHLEHPRRGVEELARVARGGVLVAEPWRPTDGASQQTAAALDAWCKAHHRRQGMCHDPDVPAERLVDWLRSAGDFEITVETVSRPVDIVLDEVAADLAAAVADLPAVHEEHTRAAEWLERARQTGVGATGSALVIARRR